MIFNGKEKQRNQKNLFLSKCWLYVIKTLPDLSKKIYLPGGFYAHHGSSGKMLFHVRKKEKEKELVGQSGKIYLVFSRLKDRSYFLKRANGISIHFIKSPKGNIMYEKNLNGD